MADRVDGSWGTLTSLQGLVIMVKHPRETMGCRGDVMVVGPKRHILGGHILVWLTSTDSGGRRNSSYGGDVFSGSWEGEGFSCRGVDITSWGIVGSVWRRIKGKL